MIKTVTLSQAQYAYDNMAEPEFDEDYEMAMDDNDVNRGALLASLVVHEAGFAGSESSAAEAGTLADPAAADLLGQEMERGAACLADFSLADHMSMFDRPLAEVREQFGVVPPADPSDGHHHW